MQKAMNHPGLALDGRTTDLDFTNDIALAADEDHICQEMTTNLAEHRLHISQEKTKVIRTNHTSDSQPIHIGQAEPECVDHFTYLVSVTLKDGDAGKEVNA